MYIMCHIDKSPQETLKGPANTVFIIAMFFLEEIYVQTDWFVDDLKVK